MFIQENAFDDAVWKMAAFCPGLNMLTLVSEYHAYVFLKNWLIQTTFPVVICVLVCEIISFYDILLSSVKRILLNCRKNIK